MSLKIQRQESKDEILQGYLNTIYFGRGAYGIQAAAQAYFDKDAKDLTVQEGAVLASVLNSPTAFDPADGADARQRLLGRYQYVLDGMASHGQPRRRAAAERLKQRLPKFPRIKSEDQYGGQRGHMLTLVKRELLAQGLHRPGDLRRRAEGDHHLHPQRDGRGRPGGARAEAEGPQGPARRRSPRSTRGPARSRASTAARTTSRARSTTRPAPPARRARPSSRSRWPPGIKDGYSPEEHLRRQLAVRLPQRPGQGRQRGAGRRQRLRQRDLADQGDRGVGEHRVRRPHPVDGRRPAEDPGHGREDGRPGRTRRASSRSPASRSARPRSARSTWPTPTARSPTAAGPRSGTSSTR